MTPITPALFPSISSATTSPTALLKLAGKIITLASLCIAAVAFILTLFTKSKPPIIYSPSPKMMTSTVEAPQSKVNVKNQKVPEINQDQKDTIVTIFKTAATSIHPGKLYSLNDHREKLKQVHPFAFLKNAPKEHLRTIFTNKGSWWIPGSTALANTKIDGVMKGISDGLSTAEKENNLECYLDDFAAEMKKEPSKIREFLSNKNWRGLVEHLFDIA